MNDSPIAWRIALPLIATAIGCGAVLSLARGWLTWQDGWIAYLGIAVIALGLVLTYVFVAVNGHTRTRRTGDHQFGGSSQLVLERVQEFASRLDFENALVFYDLVVEPSRRIERITESAEPYTRSIAVKTTLALNLPLDELEGPVVVPVVVRTKGKLDHGLRFFGPSGERISSLRHTTSLAYSAAVLRLFVEMAGGAAAITEYRADVEPAVLGLLTRSTPVSKDELDLVGDQVAALPRLGQAGWIYLMANRLLRRLVADALICVVVDGQKRRSLRRKDVIRQLEQELLLLNTKVPALNPLDRPLTFGQPLRLAVEKRVTASRISISRGRAWFVEAILAFFGVRSSVFLFPLDNADRAASYHLEFRGPENSYLAGQAIIDYPSGDRSDTSVLNFAMQERLGQRRSHLYIRHGESYVSRYFMNKFFERMPGSMPPVALSAFAAMVVIWIAALRNWTGAAGTPSADIIAWMFAFPPVIAAWAGFQGGGFRGGLLVARLFALGTIVCCLAAAALYLLDAVTIVPFPKLGSHGHWTIVAMASLMIFIGCVASILVRALTFRRFVSR